MKKVFIILAVLPLVAGLVLGIMGEKTTGLMLVWAAIALFINASVAWAAGK